MKKLMVFSAVMLVLLAGCKPPHPSMVKSDPAFDPNAVSGILIAPFISSIVEAEDPQRQSERIMNRILAELLSERADYKFISSEQFQGAVMRGKLGERYAAFKELWATKHEVDKEFLRELKLTLNIEMLLVPHVYLWHKDEADYREGATASATQVGATLTLIDMGSGTDPLGSERRELQGSGAERGPERRFERRRRPARRRRHGNGTRPVRRPSLRGRRDARAPIDRGRASAPRRDAVMDDERWMGEALAEASKAFRKNEVPIGAVVVKDGRVIARGYNRVEARGRATAHAEIIAIDAASRVLGDWRLDGCTVYVTVEPCHMCMGAFYLSRVGRVVFGAKQPRSGACGSIDDFHEAELFNHRIEVTGGVREAESLSLLQRFFERVRSG